MPGPVSDSYEGPADRCPECNGTGLVQALPNNPHADMQDICGSCSGSGWLDDDDESNVFTHCNVCGVKLRHGEPAMGMCDRCASE